MSDRICETLGKHAAALREIQLLLDGKPWMLCEVRRIAHILEKAGYAVHTTEGGRAYIALPALPADHQHEIPRR